MARHSALSWMLARFMGRISSQSTTSSERTLVYGDHEYYMIPHSFLHVRILVSNKLCFEHLCLTEVLADLTSASVVFRESLFCMFEHTDIVCLLA